ncbi:MAG TPA: thermonuclease family protein, partial [Azospirillaceae bacterium]|nr:thermonuclease family protein [Azospirillaceae bacterium]
MRAFLLLLALALLTAATTPPLTVVEVADGDTLRLDDGRWVRLAGIEAPRLGVRGEKPWPLAEAARDALAGLVEGRSVKLRGAREDRYGRVLAQVTRDDGLWIAGEMLRLGLARVHTWPDDRDRAAEMLAIERTARGARRGLWAERFYAALSPEEAEDHLDSFQIVEGLVVQA